MKLLLAALASLCASPALAAPFQLGFITDHSVSQTTIAVTTTADCPVGAVLFGIGGSLIQSNTDYASSVADNLGTHNTYSVGNGQGINSGDIALAPFYSKITHDLPSGSVLTVTIPTATTFRFIGAWCSTDFTFAASPNDINPTSDGAGATGTGTATTFTSAALFQSAEQAWGYVAWDDGSGGSTATEDANWTHLTTVFLTGGTTFPVNIAYRNTSATTALTYAPTLSASFTWLDNMMTFKEQLVANQAGAPMSMMGAGQ